MQRTSESIGALAAALAKAQIELVNPDKSMLAAIEASGRAEGNQIFRYAPLSSGLDIVRKTLGRHEIATDRPRRLTRPARLSISQPYSRIRRGNGSLRIGPFVRLTKWQARSAWARRLPMPGDMRSSHWSGSRARTISMRRTWTSPNEAAEFGRALTSNGDRKHSLSRRRPVPIHERMTVSA